MATKREVYSTGVLEFARDGDDGTITLVWCNDESTQGRCWDLFEALAFVGSPVVGGLLGWYLGCMNWKPITADELQNAITPATLAFLKTRTPPDLLVSCELVAGFTNR